MLAGAIICYAVAIGVIMFLPALHTAGDMQTSMLQLFQAGPAGDMWFGAVLLVLAVAGIVFTAMKKKHAVRISAGIGCVAFVVGIVSLATSGITVENLGADIFALLLPLLFIWAAVSNGMYLFLLKNKER
ncbi:MAG: hypothetical protein ACOYU3_03905 [Bacillota bacterium]